MLIKLIRPLLETGWPCTKSISTKNLSISSVLFQHSFSGTNSGASSKPTEKAPNLKNKQGINENRNETISDNEQERSQQEGPADREAERKTLNTDQNPNFQK